MKTEQRQLKDLTSVGPAFLADFELLGISKVADPARPFGQRILSPAEAVLPNLTKRYNQYLRA